MKHPLHLLALPLALSLVACQSANAPAPRVANLGQDIQLAPGEQVAFRKQEFIVEFVKVTEDSRCPIDVTCVWAGEVKVELSTRGNAAAAVSHEIKAGEDVMIGAFRMVVVQVQPERVSTREISPEQYRVTLTVEQASP